MAWNKGIETIKYEVNWFMMQLKARTIVSGRPPKAGRLLKDKYSYKVENWVILEGIDYDFSGGECQRVALASVLGLTGARETPGR
jgi:ABC-type glutathione transport system ATPase component